MVGQPLDNQYIIHTPLDVQLDTLHTTQQNIRLDTQLGIPQDIRTDQRKVIIVHTPAPIAPNIRQVARLVAGLVGIFVRVIVLIIQTIAQTIVQVMLRLIQTTTTEAMELLHTSFLLT